MIPSLLFSTGWCALGGTVDAHTHMATGSMWIHAGNQRMLMHI